MHLTDTLSYLPSGAFDVGLPGHAPYYCLETCLARDFWSWLGAGVWVVRGEYEGVGGVQSFGGRGEEGRGVITTFRQQNHLHLRTIKAR